MISKSCNSKNVIQKLRPFIELSKLPEDLYISTITSTCGWDTELNTLNIGKYIELSKGNIVSVKYGNDDKSIRTLIKQKKKIKRKTKKVQNFYNQATVIIEARDKKLVNIKLFRNGSIQITGCKNVGHCLDALTKLCRELRKVKVVYDPFAEDGKKMVRKPFATKPENIDLVKVSNFIIHMINSNFAVDFRIDREELFRILTEENVRCIYEPCVHACVNIKYNYKNTDIISIFVFESGSIIITGAKNKDQIMRAYSYINTILYDKYDQIVKNNIESFLKRKDVQEMIRQAA